MRIDSQPDGTEKTYRLKGRPGGRTTKVLQFMVKVYQSSGNEAEVGLDVEQGPDGEIYGFLKAGLIAYTVVDTTPVLLTGAVGNVDANNEVVGEWTLPIIKIKKTGAGSGSQFAVVEFWEMRKPF